MTTRPVRDPLWLALAMHLLGALALAVGVAILVRGVVGCVLDRFGAL